MEEKRKENRNPLSIVIPVLIALWVVLIVADITTNLFAEQELAQTAPAEEEVVEPVEKEEMYESGLPAEARWGQENEEEEE